MSLVKNPMILLAIVALGITLGMPKLMENSEFFRHAFPTVPNRWQWTLRCAPSLSNIPDHPLSRVRRAMPWPEVVSIWPGGWLAPHPALSPMPTRPVEVRQAGIPVLLGGEASRSNPAFSTIVWSRAARTFRPKSDASLL